MECLIPQNQQNQDEGEQEMSSPIFDAMGNSNNILTAYQQFRQQFQNVNPKDEVMRMLQNGRINQQQLNQVQQVAQQYKSMLGQ